MFAKLGPLDEDYAPKQINNWVVLDSCVGRKQVRAARRALAKGPVQDAKRIQKARKIAEHRGRNRGGITNGEWVAPLMCVCVALVVVVWSF